ncbi:MAG: MBL fold metallo-hydrolase [Thermomicrobium sp.]|nr:MBL fold metallo-hydrolase [Thermomicrobium sp.]MDW8058970.1 MBL fold metallo-hydrolase [Thermomicrobium sp.]
MEVVCFGSGSKGNAFLVRSRRAAVLVDAGFGPRALRDSLLRCGIGDHELAAILVTHEHSDHVRGLVGFLRRQSCPVLATSGTLQALRLEGVRQLPLHPGRWVEIGDLAFQPVPVAHDAAEPIGLTIASASARAALFTDLGSVSDAVRAELREAHLVILEANHDRDLLENGPYPSWLKRRIASPYGHLSNDDAAEAARSCGPQLRALWLAHLSEENNRPQLARSCVARELGLHRDVRLLTLPQRGFCSWPADEPRSPQG